MSQVNHNYSYIFEVDGFTVWERLRNIRNFLNDRTKALGLAELAIEKHEAKKASKEAKLNKLKAKQADLEEEGVSNDDLDDEIIDLTFEIREDDINFQDHLDLTQDCRDELKFLKEFEARLMVEAEKTRVPGKSDREMYELNFPAEARTRLFNKSLDEMISMGRLSENTLHYLRKDTEVAQRLVTEGILSADGLKALTNNGSEGLAIISNLIEAKPYTALEHKLTEEE